MRTLVTVEFADAGVKTGTHRVLVVGGAVIWRPSTLRNWVSIDALTVNNHSCSVGQLPHALVIWEQSIEVTLPVGFSLRARCSALDWVEAGYAKVLQMPVGYTTLKQYKLDVVGFTTPTEIRRCVAAWP